MTRLIVNPATAAPITAVPEAGVEDVAKAVDLVRGHADALAELETKNCGNLSDAPVGWY